MRRIVILLTLICCVFGANAKEDRLTGILKACIAREEVSPDSIKQNLEILEDEYAKTSGVRKAVTATCLAQLYAMRSYSEVTGKWTARSAELYREVLTTYRDVLYNESTKAWTPLVTRGKNENIYGGRMLYVAWRSAMDYMPDSISMTEEQLIDYYATQGNRKPAKVKAEIKRLQQANDSIWKRAPHLTIHMAEVYYPGDSLCLDMDTANVSGVVVAVYDAKGKLLEKNPVCAPSEPGKYILKATCKADVRLNRKPQVVEQEFFVSRMQAFVQDMPQRKIRVNVVDAKTGAPCKDATIRIDEKNREVSVALGVDSFLPKLRYWQTYNYNRPANKYSTHIAIYTDRSIYRPGQTIEVAAIVYEQKHWDAQVRAGDRMIVQLMDAENNVLDTAAVVTDSFGTVRARFVIPEKVKKLGWFIVWVGNSMRTVRVEEYKRPEFYVEMDETERWSRNDSVVYVSGKALNYNGTPVSYARVTGTAQRVCCWWWKRQRYTDSRTLDTVQTDRNGCFCIPVKLEKGVREYRYYPSLDVEVNVLSRTGEQHSVSAFLRLFDDPQQEVEDAVAKKKWVECPKDSFDVGRPATIEFRNMTGRRMHVYMTGYAKDKVVLDSVYEVRDTLQVFGIPYVEEYGDGMNLQTTYVMDGEVHSKEFKLKRFMPKTMLTLHWDTFRDYTQPGALQQWTLRLTEPDGDAAKANVMMTVYDASLDALRKNNWNLNLGMSHFIPFAQVRWDNCFDLRGEMLSQSFDVWTNRIKDYSFSRLASEYFEEPYRLTKGHLLRNDRVMYATANIDESRASGVKIRGNGKLEDDSSEDVQLRTDFSETAMFRPQLRTDAQGRVSVSFRIPQSLTTWTVKGIANTSAMHYAEIENKVVARKALMSELSLPRFVREGDRAAFTVKVTNTSAGDQKGRMQVLVRQTNGQKTLLKKDFTFSLSAGSDSVYTVEVSVPEGIDGLSVRTTAKGKTDSDGELREIPVLDNTEDFCNTKALTLKAQKTEKITWNDMFPEGSVNRQLIVETNTDPRQSVVDALRNIRIPENDDVLSQAAAYYATSRLGDADTTVYIGNVAALQGKNGGMTWYNGMYESEYLSTEVGYMLARLCSRGSEAERVLQGIRRFLVQKMEERIENRNRISKDWTLNLYDLRSMYVLTVGGNLDKKQTQLVKTLLKHLPEGLDKEESEFVSLALIVENAYNGKVKDSDVEILRHRLVHTDGTYLAYREGAWPSIDRRIHIHTQAMETLWRVSSKDAELLDGMSNWLLSQKRTQGWSTPVNCVDAAFAVLGMENGKIASLGSIVVPGGSVVKRDTLDIMRRSNYVVSNRTDHDMWVGVYADYALPIDKVESSATELGVKDITEAKEVKVGDRFVRRMLVKADRDYEFVRLTVPHCAAVEPVVKLSGCTWQNGLSMYREMRDNRTDYFIQSLPHGEYIIEMEFTVERHGEYETGVPVIRCEYADEYQGHGVSEELRIKN